MLAAAAHEADAVGRRLASFKDAIVDASRHDRVVAALPARAVPSESKAAAEALRVERALREGPDALGMDERFRLLSSPTALAQLRAEVAAHRAHPDWGREHKATHPPEPYPAVREVEGALAESL